MRSRFLHRKRISLTFSAQQDAYGTGHGQAIEPGQPSASSLIDGYRFDLLVQGHLDDRRFAVVQRVLQQSRDGQGPLAPLQPMGCLELGHGKPRRTARSNLAECTSFRWPTSSGTQA